MQGSSLQDDFCNRRYFIEQPSRVGNPLSKEIPQDGARLKAEPARYPVAPQFSQVSLVPASVPDPRTLNIPDHNRRRVVRRTTGGQEYRDVADVDDMVGGHHLHLRFSWKNMVHDVSMRRDTGLDWASDKYEQGLKGLLTPRKVPISERVWHDMEMS